MDVRRGDIVYLKDDGSVLTKRPYLIVSNDTGNHHSDICLGTPLTANLSRQSQPTHCVVGSRKSLVLAEQIYTIHKDDVNRIVLHLGDDEMRAVDDCLKTSLALDRGRYDDDGVA